MSNYFSALIAICFVTKALGNGKEPVPNLPSLPAPTKAPFVYPAQGKTVLRCFEGYTLDGGLCTKEFEFPASPACPGSLSADGLGCKVEVPYIYQCPAGFYSVEAKCEKVSEVSPQFFCPIGFADDGNSCVKSTPGESVTQCDIGELIGGNCVSIKKMDHLISAVCPDGSKVENDGNCWKVVGEYDCTEPAAVQQRVVVPKQNHTPVGMKVLVQKGGKKFRHLNGKSSPPPAPPSRPVEDKGCHKEMVAVSPPQAIKVDVATKICNRKVQVDALAVVSCPENFLDTGDSCVLETTTPARVICLSGNAADGGCAPVVTRVPKTPGCPINAFKSKGKCYETEETEPSKLCGKGFTANGSSCIGVIPSPGWECPPGLVLEGSICYGTKVRNPITIRLEPEASEKCDSKKY